VRRPDRRRWNSIEHAILADDSHECGACGAIVENGEDHECPAADCQRFICRPARRQRAEGDVTAMKTTPAKPVPAPEVIPPVALAVVPPEAELLAVSRSPEAVILEAMEAAKAIKAIIDAKPKPFKIRGETYLQFEDWQTVARFYGVTVRVVETKATKIGEAVGSWRAPRRCSWSTGASSPPPTPCA
jgi:hypothetical protein